MFLDYAIAQPGSAETMTPLILEMRDRAFLKEKRIEQMLIARLVQDGAFRPASLVEQAFGPPQKRSGFVRDSDFAEPQFHFPFGWEMIEGASVWAQRDPSPAGPALLYHGATGGAGPVATQLLTLPAGRYRLAARSAAPAADANALPYWTVTCAGRQPLQIALVDEDGAAQGDFAVPPGCNGQWLAFNLRASDRGEGQSGAIRWVRVEPR
jgi:hypothetical protein